MLGTDRSATSVSCRSFMCEMLPPHDSPIRGEHRQRALQLVPVLSFFPAAAGRNARGVVEGDEIATHRRGRTVESLPGEPFGQFGVGVVGQRIFAMTGRAAGIEVSVAKVKSAVAEGDELVAKPGAGGDEARKKIGFRRGRR